MKKKLLDVLAGNRHEIPPVWLMRQAGRYLPEYRDLRAQAGGFLDLVYNPDFAAEVTIQPIRRFGFDAAILFSDILVVPHALGRDLRFDQGEGPRMTPLRKEDLKLLKTENSFDETIDPVFSTVKKIKNMLRQEGFNDTTLIGFAGGPWTVACYMIEGQGGDFPKALEWLGTRELEQLLDLIADVTARYLVGQVKAGAEVLQIFESWAGLAPPQHFEEAVIRPMAKIVALVRQACPDTPIIGFPRGCGSLYESYAARTGIAALGLDQDVAPKVARGLQQILPVQGHLDPLLLLQGGEAMEKSVNDILDNLSAGPHVFNLGHGIIKETPIAHVERLVAVIRKQK